MDENVCSSLERWDGVVMPADEELYGQTKLPKINAKLLDVRVPLMCRDPGLNLPGASERDGGHL